LIHTIYLHIHAYSYIFISQINTSINIYHTYIYHALAHQAPRHPKYIYIHINMNIYICIYTHIQINIYRIYIHNALAHLALSNPTFPACSSHHCRRLPKKKSKTENKPSDTHTHIKTHHQRKIHTAQHTEKYASTYILITYTRTYLRNKLLDLWHFKFTRVVIVVRYEQWLQILNNLGISRLSTKYFDSISHIYIRIYMCIFICIYIYMYGCIYIYRSSTILGSVV